MAVNQTNPFLPPESWVDILLRLPSQERPRILVSLSAGRGSYRPIRDIVPSVTRVTDPADETNPDRDTVTIELGEDFVPCGCREAAEQLWTDACQKFLDTKRTGSDAAFIKAGRIQLKLLNDGREVGVDSLDVDRKAFGELDDVVERGTSLGDQVVRVLEAHCKTLGAQFIQLAKVQSDSAEKERVGLIDTARGAVDIIKEAAEYKTAAAVQMAEAAAAGGIWATDAGQALLLTGVEVIPKGLETLSLFLDARKAEAEARKAEAEAKLFELQKQAKSGAAA